MQERTLENAVLHVNTNACTLLTMQVFVRRAAGAFHGFVLHTIPTFSEFVSARMSHTCLDVSASVYICDILFFLNFTFPGLLYVKDATVVLVHQQTPHDDIRRLDSSV